MNALQLPYTVDFKDGEAKSHKLTTADPFLHFFSVIAGYNWMLPSMLNQYRESAEMLELALTVPFKDQAKIQAVKMVTAFVKDVAYTVGNGTVTEDAINRLSHTSRWRTGKDKNPTIISFLPDQTGKVRALSDSMAIRIGGSLPSNLVRSKIG